MLALLDSQPDMSASDMAAAMNVTLKKVYEVRYQLRRRGLVAQKEPIKALSEYPCKGRPGRRCLTCDLPDCELPYWKADCTEEKAMWRATFGTDE